MKHCFINFVAALFVAINVAGVSAQENVVRIPDDKSVCKGRLPNGLTY